MLIYLYIKLLFLLIYLRNIAANVALRLRATLLLSISDKLLAAAGFAAGLFLCYASSIKISFNAPTPAVAPDKLSVQHSHTQTHTHRLTDTHSSSSSSFACDLRQSQAFLCRLPTPTTTPTRSR